MAARRLRAFTVIEGLFASMILAIAITGIFGLCVGMYRRLGQAQYAAEAGQLARAEVERAKVYGMDNLPAGTYNATTGSATWTGAYSPATNTWVPGGASYFDYNGNRLASATTAGAVMKVQAQVLDSNVLATSSGYAFQLESRRSFVVTVTSTVDGSEIMTMATNIAPGGI